MSREPHLTGELEFACRAARQAGDLILEHYRNGVVEESKSDASPVTVADRAAEKLLRKMIASDFPDDGILGEEYGEVPGRSGRRWILDPIDGTRSFVQGVPQWGVLIALEDQGRSVVGVVHLAALNETVWAARGKGAWWLPGHRPAGDQSPRPARVSGVSRLADAMLTVCSVGHFEKTGRLAAFARLRGACKLDRGWGDCYGHMLVATGRAEIMLDPRMAIWDNAALAPILIEAGGTFSDWAGNFTHTGPDAISTNAAVYEAVLSLIQSA